MEGDEGSIFSKPPECKSLFSLKIKIKQSSGCPNKEYNAIFMHMKMQCNENIKAYSRSEKKNKLN